MAGKKGARWVSPPHGHARSRSPTYKSWLAMLGRCRPGRVNSDRYYDKGVRVCERWASSFPAFLEDVGERPDGMTLDRIDTSLGYEPGNCRWATPVEQARNRKSTRLTFEIALDIALRVFRGETAASVAREHGVSYAAVRGLMAGKSWKDAMAEAVKIQEELA